MIVIFLQNQKLLILCFFWAS